MTPGRLTRDLTTAVAYAAVHVDGGSSIYESLERRKVGVHTDRSRLMTKLQTASAQVFNVYPCTT